MKIRSQELVAYPLHKASRTLELNRIISNNYSSCRYYGVVEDDGKYSELQLDSSSIHGPSVRLDDISFVGLKSKWCDLLAATWFRAG